MHTLLDFFEAAPEMGLADRTMMEIRKLSARLGLDEDEDLVEYPADLKTFEEAIAPAGAALFAKAQHPTQARKQANSRIRTALKAFLAAEAGDDARPDHRADWDRLRTWVLENEGFIDQGARFTTGASRTIACLKARFAETAPWALDTDAVVRVLAGVPAEKRKAVRKAVRFLARLQETPDALPAEIRNLLPGTRLSLPVRDTQIGRAHV